MVEKCRMKVIDVQIFGSVTAYDMKCLTHGEEIRVYGRKIRKCNRFFDEMIKEELDRISKMQNSERKLSEGLKDE